MTSLETSTRTKFHISLNVKSLPETVNFYRVLFAMEPAKQFDDYAKFEIEEPPVVFSLAPVKAGCGGVLSNIGIQVSGPEKLKEIEERLNEAGIKSRLQTDALCGYARQVKLWVQDPDGNHWELYVPGEDVDPGVVQRSIDGQAADDEPVAATTWEHRLSEELPERLPHADESLDEVQLLGTLNGPFSRSQLERVMAETWRVLRPGGKLLVHGLAADKSFPKDQPALPGLAALISNVPLEEEAVNGLKEAGFVGIQITKLSTRPIFEHDGVEMREQKLVAWKPNSTDSDTRELMYKGPFNQAVDENGQVYPRGKRVRVPVATWDRLRESLAAEQFLFLQPGDRKAAAQGSSCGCG